MLSKLAFSAKNSKLASVSKKLSFKEKVDLCLVSVVVGVSMYCTYKVGMDYYDLRNPSTRKPETEKQN